MLLLVLTVFNSLRFSFLPSYAALSPMCLLQSVRRRGWRSACRGAGTAGWRGWWRRAGSCHWQQVMRAGDAETCDGAFAGCEADQVLISPLVKHLMQVCRQLQFSPSSCHVSRCQEPPLFNCLPITTSLFTGMRRFSWPSASMWWLSESTLCPSASCWQCSTGGGQVVHFRKMRQRL